MKFIFLVSLTTTYIETALTFWQESILSSKLVSSDFKSYHEFLYVFLDFESNE